MLNQFVNQTFWNTNLDQLNQTWSFYQLSSYINHQCKIMQHRLLFYHSLMSSAALTTYFLLLLIAFIWSLKAHMDILQCQFYFNSLSNNEFWNLLIIADYCDSLFFCKISSPVKNPYLPTFPDNNAEILAFWLSNLYGTLFCSILVSNLLVYWIKVIS